MKYFVFVFIFSYLLLNVSGCHKDIPKPETKTVAEHVAYTDLRYDIPVIGVVASNKSPFFVKYQVRGRDVFIECIVHGVTFREANSTSKGRIILSVDGKKREEISAAAFIVKGLQSGTHRIKLEVVKGHNENPIMNKEFYVTIP